jgi:hypothetical protein
MRRALREPISRPVWQILASWGLAVLLISFLLSAWIWKNEREQDAENREVQREQDQAMCVMIDLFAAGPPPVAGPAGDRGRVILKAMNAYREALRCDSFPVRPRD